MWDMNTEGQMDSVACKDYTLCNAVLCHLKLDLDQLNKQQKIYITPKKALNYLTDMITQDRKLDDIKYSVKTRKKKTEERKETDASNRKNW